MKALSSDRTHFPLRVDRGLERAGLTCCESFVGVHSSDEDVLLCELLPVPPAHHHAVLTVEQRLPHSLQLTVQLDGLHLIDEVGCLSGVDEEEEAVVHRRVNADGQYEEAPQSEAETAGGQQQTESQQVGGQVREEEEDVGEVVQPVAGRLHHVAEHDTRDRLAGGGLGCAVTNGQVRCWRWTRNVFIGQRKVSSGHASCTERCRAMVWVMLHCE